MPTAPTATQRSFEGHVPTRAPIDAYGNGGFRFAGMSHRGSILCLADGIHAWNVAAGCELSLVGLAAVLEKLHSPQFLLLGTGNTQIFPALDIRNRFAARLVGLEVMDTGAAARTFNVLLAEQRPVMAALIAVD